MDKRIKMCLLLMPSEQSLFNKYVAQMPPISYGIIAAELQEKGIDVDLIDLNKVYREAEDVKEAQELLKSIYDGNNMLDFLKGKENEEFEKMADWMLPSYVEEYDYIGCSMGADFSFSQIHLGLILGLVIKKRYGKEVILGGNNISYLYIYRDFYEELWEGILDNFKYIVKGPGEKAILDIIEIMNDTSSKKMVQDIKGLAYKEKGQVLFKEERSPLVIKPSWEGLDMSFYNNYLSKDETIRMNTLYKWPTWTRRWVDCFHRVKSNKSIQQLVLPYIFNFNCIYNCAFCTQSDTERGKIIYKDSKKVVDDLEYMSKKYGTPHFYFLNNSFNYKHGAIETFCQEVIERKLKIYWSDCARVNNLTYNRLKLMKEAGCQKLVFGFESGSLKILDLVNKQLNLESLEEVLKWCYELEIWAELEVIIGLPQETEDEFMETYNFLKKNKKYINYFWTNEYFLVPNSLIGKDPEKYGIKIHYDTYTYRGLLEWNQEMFMNNQWDFPHNARIYTFDEINGRKSEEISIQNKEKVNRLSKLYHKEFKEVETFYKRMLGE